MTTAYTYAVSKEGNTDFNEFVWLCARAMGAFIHQRDESLNAKLRYDVSRFYRDLLTGAKKELADAQNRTTAQWDQRLTKARTAQFGYAKDISEKKAEAKANLTKMLKQVRKWTPPTPEHEGLKKFMVEQLVDTIDHDCSSSPNLLWVEEPDLAEYAAEEIRFLTNRVKTYEEEALREEQRERAHIKWIDALRASVPVPKHKDGFKK